MNLTVWSGNPAEIEVTANTNLHHRGGGISLLNDCICSTVWLEHLKILKKIPLVAIYSLLQKDSH